MPLPNSWYTAPHSELAIQPPPFRRSLKEFQFQATEKPSAIAEMTVAAIAVALLLAPCAMAANTYKVVHAFNGQDGAAPFSALILDASGNFYGTTSSGGILGGGTVSKLTPIANGSWTESVLYNLLGGSGGYFPYAGLTLDSVGNLYGAATLGGNTSCNKIEASY